MGLCAQELVVSGLRLDLVRWYTPSVVLFLKIYDEVLSLLSGRFLVSRSCYGGQVSERAGLVGVNPRLGLLSGCNSDHSGPAASSTVL